MHVLNASSVVAYLLFSVTAAAPMAADTKQMGKRLEHYQGNEPIPGDAAIQKRSWDAFDDNHGIAVDISAREDGTGRGPSLQRKSAVIYGNCYVPPCPGHAKDKRSELVDVVASPADS
ncbi:hypothetical protein GTA08_BOTSDO05976 [Botryosphaeria dothidea]|uniref:Uncharacterized protein n=1 Tax=Botryosphaeria dothidea TaxID=55169 RepID=A0A8H4N4C4_9PEZI|nr:hypothetical protein GTA08_BOTSDO05976 [Botryosphaeria dothidea]